MKFPLTLIAFLLAIGQSAEAGVLSGRIVNDDGSPLGRAEITIENQTVKTNEFGGYRVTLADGERELSMSVNGIAYTSDKIVIYSPEVKQNWRLNANSKRLTKIR